MKDIFKVIVFGIEFGIGFYIGYNLGNWCEKHLENKINDYKNYKNYKKYSNYEPNITYCNFNAKNENHVTKD
jgi:hypothetical protein